MWEYIDWEYRSHISCFTLYIIWWYLVTVPCREHKPPSLVLDLAQISRCMFSICNPSMEMSRSWTSSPSVNHGGRKISRTWLDNGELAPDFLDVMAKKQTADSTTWSLRLPNDQVVGVVIILPWIFECVAFRPDLMIKCPKCYMEDLGWHLVPLVASWAWAFCN